MGSRLRTFIAIDFDPVIRGRLVALQEKQAAVGTPVKWVEPENLHLTLLFLGEVEYRDSPQVCRAVADCCAAFSPFPMTVEGVGCFPNPRRPRILWAGVSDGTAEIQAVHDALEPPLMDLGCYRREERNYTPHVTLGRVKTEEPVDALAALLLKQAAWSAGSMMVHELCVMSSDWKATGPKVRGPRNPGPSYMVLSRARLGGA